MTATLTGKTGTALRIACLTLVLMAPVIGTMANRQAIGPGVSHGVGLALLVTLQRTSTF